MLPKGLDRLSVGELRKLCEDRGLPTEGLIKSQLIEQLKAAEGITKMQEKLRAELAGAIPKSPQGGLGSPKPTEGKDKAEGMKISTPKPAEGKDQKGVKPPTPKPEGEGSPKTGDKSGRGNDSEVLAELEIKKLELQMKIEREKRESREREIEMENERERMNLEIEKERERERLALENERERLRLEHERANLELEKERERIRLEFEQESERVRLRHEFELAEKQRQHELTMKDKDISKVEVKGKLLGKHGPKTPKLKEGDDIEAYLRTFERLARANEWERDTWAPRLAAVLTGKAREAYAAMPIEDIESYDKVKLAVLKKYRLGSEAYREKFRTSHKKSDERFQEWGTRVSQYFDRWLEINEIADFEHLREFMIIEQLINLLSPDLQVWIRERKPETVDKLTELAELYVMSRKKTVGIGGSGKPKNSGKTNSDSKQKSKASKDNVTCYTCKAKGHYSYECPNSKQEKQDKKSSGSGAPGGKKASGLLCLSPSRPGFLNHKKFVIQGNVDSKPVDMLIDTGCTNTLVKGSLVPENAYCNDSFQILLANGMTQDVPMAKVKLSGTEGSKLCTVGVLSDLPVDVLLSQEDFSSIGKLDDESPGLSLPMIAKGDELDGKPAFIVTRAKAKALKQFESETSQMAARQGVRPISVEQLPDSGDLQSAKPTLVDKLPEGGHASTVTEDESILNPDFVSDVELDKMKATENQNKGPVMLPHIDVWKLTPKDLIERQKADAKLKKLLPKMQKSLPKDSVGYFWKDGLMYRRSFIENRQQYVDQLLVPREYKLELLELAHSIPLAGHLHAAKTRDRLFEHYTWPGIYKDVENFCATCSECQKCARKLASDKAPLISVPVIGTPFHKVAVDIVGPVERSAKGHKYLLTLVDYATRFPDAIPLKDATAPSVADGLVEMFSRYGIPAELLSDQGPNFMAELMKELLPRLGIKKLDTSCYHPQANGLVERFHATLKSMLRKFVSEEPNEWDKFLPYMLFAYREVPEVSTGFSPFELLYGRAVRGPLAILKESWTGETAEDENVVEYVLKAREKLASMAELVQENLTQSQRKQKTYYDQNARGKKYEVGEEVLVMLPSASSKLKSTWQGPFPIVRQVSPVDYEVDTGKHRKRLRIFHVNLLRKWKDREKLAFYAKAYIIDEDNVDNYLPQKEPSQTVADVKISENLTPIEKLKLRKLADNYADIFSDVPTTTNAAVHDVKLTDTPPKHTKPYRLPECYKEEVREHIRGLAEGGFTEPATGPYGSGIVIVPKKDGGIRMAVDYRALNRCSETDTGGALQRIEELIEKVSRAKYISVLDLAKGYYAIPLTEAAKMASTFVSPFGSYRFRVMQFGMKNAPSTFTRMMANVLDGTEEYAVVYIDDIAVFSDTFEDHLKHLEEVFTRLRKANLKVKPSKCILGGAVVEYLGHMVGSGKVEPVDAKVEAIAAFKLPETKKGLRSFLGLVGYYRKFIPSFSEIAAPLTDLTRKSEPSKIRWTEAAEKAFADLKLAMQNHPVLVPPDFTKPFILQVDASQRGLGAVLAQTDADGEEHPIVYCSRKLLDREMRLATIEKECLAIVWSVKLLRPYLLGHEVILETDHNPLVWLGSIKDSNQKLLRWSLMLQEYNITIRHKKGSQNAGPDCLSRV